MENKRIDKNSVRSEAKQLLKSGKSKQETFNELKIKYKYSKDVAEIVKYIPSNKAKKKFGIWNFVLLTLLILTIIFNMIVAPSIGIIIWYGLLIFIVLRMLTKYYFLVSLFYLLGIIGAIVGILNSETILWTNMIVFIIVTIPSLFLPIWISKKLCPPPNERKELYIDNTGHQRLRIIYEFMDL